MVYAQVKRVIHNVLGDSAIVYSYRGYTEYMEIVRRCDMFINPFPFGNTNGIIDTVTAGLIGICKSGPEVNEHIDQGLFERFGMPNWLVTTDNEGYIAATVKLVENHDLRNELRRKHAGPDKVQRIFQGRPEIMGQMFLAALEKRAGKADKVDQADQAEKADQANKPAAAKPQVKPAKKGKAVEA